MDTMFEKAELSKQTLNKDKSGSAMTSMLMYYKTILQKVSFDKNLFNKELIKASRDLDNNEFVELYNWCKQQFNWLLQPANG